MPAHLVQEALHTRQPACCADISTFGWVFAAPWAGVELSEFPNVQRWMDRIAERPAVKEGLDVPEPNSMKEMMKDPKKMQEAIDNAQAMMVKAT